MAIADIDLNKIKTLDEFISLVNSVGSIEKALSNNLYGINHTQVEGILPENRDTYGFTFFTRPQLNFTSSNLRNSREFYNLLSTKPASIQRYVRCVLDPRLARRTSDPITSPLVDEKMAFITVLTNNLNSISGWPDIVAPSFNSASGVRKEQWSIVDGVTQIYDAFDIDATFRNIKNEPIIMLMQNWLAYMSAVYEGTLSPYLDYITTNRIDYNTRIYRLVLDESKRYVKKIAATGASFPVNVPTGKFFDFNKASKYNDQTKEINIRFKCNGAMYNDPIIVREFNQVSGVFNAEVAKLISGKKHNLIQIPYRLNDLFNNRGYPVIDTDTYELKWYIDKSDSAYTRILNLTNKEK